ncbi:hypothetical protein [Paenibacillus sp. FSL R5-0914]
MSFYLYQRISLPQEALGEASKGEADNWGTPFTRDIEENIKDIKKNIIS